MNGDAPDDYDLEEQADTVADFVEEILGQMDIDAIAEPTQEGERFYVDILEGPPEDLALLIGKHGQTLDAIQELARNVVGAGSTSGSASSWTWRTTGNGGLPGWKSVPVRQPSERLPLVKSRSSSPWRPLSARSSTTPWRASKAFRADPAARTRTGSWWLAPSIEDRLPA